MSFYGRAKRNWYEDRKNPRTTQNPQQVESREIDGIELEEFKGYYITPEGVIYNSRGNALQPSVDTKGYLSVSLYISGKRYTRRVHVLVAQTYLPIPPELDGKKLVVDHIDQDRTHCSVDNLQWVTQAENIAKSYEQGRISAQAFRVECIEDDKIFSSCTQASKFYGCSKASIQDAIRKRDGYVKSIDKTFRFVD